MSCKLLLRVPVYLSDMCFSIYTFSTIPSKKSFMTPDMKMRIKVKTNKKYGVKQKSAKLSCFML